MKYSLGLFIGFLFGMNYIEYAYNPANLEHNTLDFVRQSYREGCVYGEFVPDTNRKKSCETKASLYMDNIRSIFNDRIWSEK